MNGKEQGEAVAWIWGNFSVTGGRNEKREKYQSEQSTFVTTFKSCTFLNWESTQNRGSLKSRQRNWSRYGSAVTSKNWNVQFEKRIWQREVTGSNTAGRSYWKESVSKRRMITDTAWAKIWYAREGCIRYCHGRRGNIQTEKVGRFSCQSDGFIYLSKYYLCRFQILQRETDHRTGIRLLLSCKSTNGCTFFHSSYGIKCPMERLATKLEYHYGELLRSMMRFICYSKFRTLLITE
jgi:hypothetical protein